MKGILIYQPPEKDAQLPNFIDGLDPRLRERILLRIYQLSLPQAVAHSISARSFVTAS